MHRLRHSLIQSHSHSTMYLLKLFLPNFCPILVFYSHSTMYLLKRKSTAEQTGNGAYSHSTMYLLKLQTYHSLHSCISYSHSTMYLLKPYCRIYLHIAFVQFTFHHVSIKTLYALVILIFP